jgi:DNA-binding GntR family transcriptional regulator
MAAVPDARRRVQRRPLAEQVVETLRHMILSGELKPERRFSQQALAKALGVSTMPVREALLRLSHEGLITASPHRSFEVTRTTPNDIRDVYWMHSMIAGELTFRACRLADEVFLRRLHTLFEADQKALASGSVDAMEQSNWALHRAINHHAGSPRLLKVLESTTRMIPEHYFSLVPEWPSTAQRGHRAIVEAFDAGDADRARSAATSHVRAAADLIVAHLAKTGYWEPATP